MRLHGGAFAGQSAGERLAFGPRAQRIFRVNGLCRRRFAGGIFEVDFNGGIAFAENHTARFEPGAEIRTGPDITNLRTGLAHVLSESEGYIKLAGLSRRHRAQDAETAKEQQAEEPETHETKHTQALMHPEF